MNILYKKYIYNFLQFIIIFQFCFGIVTYEMAEKVAKNILIENNKSNYIIDSYFLIVKIK